MSEYKYTNKDEYWKLLNDNVYNIEDKLMSISVLLQMYGKNMSYECRRINCKPKKVQNYTYRISCSLKSGNYLFLRVYYEPDVNKTLYKIFKPFEIKTQMEILESEQQLDDILEKFTNCILHPIN